MPEENSEKEPAKKFKPNEKYIGAGLVIGIGIGAAIDNIGLGVALGLVFGAAIGNEKLKKDDK